MAAVDYDVGIVGGGPAGAAMAAYLAKAGVSCVVLERERFPRPHVGESLVPSSTRVFRELGFLDKMERAGFPRKFGAAWTATAGASVYQHDWNGLAPDSRVEIGFGERRQDGVDQNYTWHVDRAKFDQLLLEHARSLGAEVREGAVVRGADFSGADAALLDCSLGRRPAKLRVRVVVDASGRRTLLGGRLGWRVKDPVFDQFALHAWFSGYDRARVCGPKAAGYNVVHFLPLRNSWVWQIPISEELTSVGVVTQRKNFAASRASREKVFWECVASRPELLEGLKAARLARPIKEEADYSYAMTQLTGDRLLLIGDAARFVDPIFSTGVSIALNSARFAQRDILAALETGDFRRRAFGEYEKVMRRGTRNWYRFISIYYRLNVLFTAFLMEPRYRLAMLKLLQGDVYDEDEPAVLEEMRAVIKAVEGDPDHVWHRSLGELTADAFKEAAG